MKRMICAMTALLMMTACTQPAAEQNETAADLTETSSIQTSEAQTVTETAVEQVEAVVQPATETSDENTEEASLTAETTADIEAETEETHSDAPDVPVTGEFDPQSVRFFETETPYFDDLKDISYSENWFIAYIDDIALYGSLTAGDEESFDGDVLNRMVIRIVHDGIYDEFPAQWIGTHGGSFHTFGLVDCDDDNEQEIALSVTAGTGTGFYIDQPSFYKLIDGHYKQYSLSQNRYDSAEELTEDEKKNNLQYLIDSSIDIYVDNEAQTLTVNGETIDISFYYEDAAYEQLGPLTDESIEIGSHISFDRIENGKLHGVCGIALTQHLVPYTPEDIDFELCCYDGEFRLENIHITNHSTE